ncbi:membrane-spanning 4-domains subfamily A member 12-like [Protopterus annectens]|uniref:membrane-spanning 4-domains subfamily A member 12-like n=1 Tax=Protopterus annectens TaxID=7888 RepID=UPI001CF98910|nr:membrane-spanning 4-domains subfamily A member 12-like [Protopterus annectens]
MNPAVQGANGVVVMTQVYPQVDARGLQQNASLCTSKLCKMSVQVKEFMKGEPRALGTTQILIGIMNILFGIVLAFTETSIAVFSGVPFWGGLLYIISGSLSIAAEKHDSVCLVKGSLGMNIVSAIAAGTAVILYIIDASFQYYHCSYYNNYGGNSYGGSSYGGSYYDYYNSCSELQYILTPTLKCLKSIMFFFCLLEVCIAISLSAFGCKATCCTKSSSPQPVILMQNPQVSQAVPFISAQAPQMFPAQQVPQTFSPQQTHQMFPPQQNPQATQFSQPPVYPQIPPWNADSGSAPPAYHDQSYMNKTGTVNPAF